MDKEQSTSQWCFQKRSTFEAVEEYATIVTVVQEPSSDQVYNANADLSFPGFIQEKTEENFRIKDFLKNFKPTSADAETSFRIVFLDPTTLEVCFE